LPVYFCSPEAPPGLPLSLRGATFFVRRSLEKVEGRNKKEELRIADFGKLSE
jgi:hypothetical protein